jgi:hypothetical protein
MSISSLATGVVAASGAAPIASLARFRGRRMGRPALWLAAGHGVLLLVILVVVALVVFLVIRSRRS